MQTITEIVSLMNAQSEQVAAYLLPSGKSEGREWCVGSINGEPGRSLKVCLSGAKAGVWKDFAAGTGGDLLDLWREVRSFSNNKDALVEVKAYLGIKEPAFHGGSKKKAYRVPGIPKGSRPLAEGSRVMDYLINERKLTPEAIAAYKVREVSQVGPWETWSDRKDGSPAQPWTGPWIVFPFMRGGELTNVKYLHIDRPHGKKQTLVESNCEPVLFGWQVIEKDAREITVCEGEIDAMSLYVYGRPALSVPFGGGKGDKQQWVGSDWEYLETMETIWLCLDNDEEGRIATEELVSRLGVHRCKMVTLPKKDANECLKSGISKTEIDKAFAEAVMIEPDELKRPNYYTDEVIAGFYPPEGELPGFNMPWKKVPFRFLRGELTTVTGTSGHGKSLLWGQVMLGAVESGERCCIASMEMKPATTIIRMVKQATGKKLPDRTTIAACTEWMSDKIWLFDLVGTSKADRLLEVFEFAYRRHGIKQFVIDSLMKCGISEDDYRGQKLFIDTLCDFVSRTNTHIHLVAHMRKAENELTPGGKLDIKGTGAISDLAFNNFVVWRNKPKEDQLRAYENGEKVDLPKGTSITDIENSPDVVLICDKNRNGEGNEGKYALWFDQDSQQYLERKGDRIKQYFKLGGSSSAYADLPPDF